MGANCYLLPEASRGFEGATLTRVALWPQFHAYWFVVDYQVRCLCGRSAHSESKRVRSKDHHKSDAMWLRDIIILQTSAVIHRVSAIISDLILMFVFNSLYIYYVEFLQPQGINER